MLTMLNNEKAKHEYAETHRGLDVTHDEHMVEDNTILKAVKQAKS